MYMYTPKYVTIHTYYQYSRSYYQYCFTVRQRTVIVLRPLFQSFNDRNTDPEGWYISLKLYLIYSF